MHICYLTHEFPKPGFPHGGVGTFVKTLSQSLVNNGIEVTVIGINNIDKDEFEIFNGIEIHRLAMKKVRGLTWALNSMAIDRKIKEVNNKRKIDIIESTELGLAFIRKRKAIKYIIRLHGGHHFFADAENRGINRWKGFQERRSFSKADTIIGVSRYVMDHTAEYIDFSKKRGPVIFNPVDTNRLHISDQSRTIKGRIFFAGTVCEKKGIRQLLLSFPYIRDKVPDAHLVIAGRDWRFPDGSSYTEWVKQFIRPEDVNSIIFLGPVENSKIPGLIENAEVCVYPSHMEAMPLAWLEVLAMGKAFIGSKTGPGNEVVRDGITGLLCDPLNPMDIAEKTIRILSDSQLALSLGNAAREDIIERFSLATIEKQNIEFYTGLLKS